MARAFRYREGKGKANGAALVTVTMAVVLAEWLPVRRATRVNPAEALRAE